MRHWRIMAAVAMAGLLPPAPAAAAQTVIMPLERPDPASITVPDMASFKPTPSDIRRFDDYFYFHKEGVSYERAFAELDQCRGYSMVAQVGAIPPTIVPVGGPLVQDAPKRGMFDPPYSNNLTFGSPLGSTIGYALVGMIVANYMEELALATNRRCMYWKGYSRYGTSRALWKAIDTGSDTEKLARRALLASGPRPAAVALEP